MAESFVIVRAGIRIGGAWHHVVGVWHIPSFWDADDGKQLAEVVAGVVRDWFEMQARGNKGMYRTYTSSVEMQLVPPQSDALLSQTLEFPAQDLRRLRKCRPPLELSREPVHE